MKFGVVGTNWITERLLAAGQSVEGFEATAVYSRKAERAAQFAEHHHIAAQFSDWEDFLASDIEAVYIATPNLLHEQQAVDAMNHGKHVLCEKPLTLTVHQAERMFEAARRNNVVLMEAMKSTEAAAFKQVEKWLPNIGNIRRVNFHYNQYSSRYDKLKQGIIENAFKPELGNGALMDLGVYTIAPLVKLFGMPENVKATAERLSTGADGQGTALCIYPQMTAALSYSKIIDSYLPSEIIGEEGIILIDKISAPSHVQWLDRTGEVKEVFEHHAPPMSYELETFINGHVDASIEQMSIDTLKVVSHIKEQTGILKEFKE